jgi:hypothetical protein
MLPYFGFWLRLKPRFPFDMLCEVMETDAKTVHRALRELRAYLRVTGTGEESHFALFHSTLADWLTNFSEAGDYWCPAVEGQARLAHYCLKWSEIPEGSGRRVLLTFRSTYVVSSGSVAGWRSWCLRAPSQSTSDTLALRLLARHSSLAYQPLCARSNRRPSGESSRVG